MVSGTLAWGEAFFARPPGLPPTGKRVGVPEIGIARFVEGKWKDRCYFGNELGMLLQLGAPNLLLSSFA